MNKNKKSILLDKREVKLALQMKGILLSFQIILRALYIKVKQLKIINMNLSLPVIFMIC